MFKRKKNTETIPFSPPPCQHKWKDFSWYLEEEFDLNNKDREYNECEFEVIEPYVCIYCKERKNVVLYNIGYSNVDQQDYCRYRQQIISDCGPNLKPRVVVEDEIHDFILVDREYLKIAEQLRGENSESH